MEKDAYIFKESPYLNKLFTLENLIPKIQDLKRHNKKIVLTNGCFDLLHVGHIRALRHAKSLGHILVVAVNSDRSVKEYKGDHLPIISEKERLEVLASFYMIDFLVIFGETTVEKILLELKPHIHAKGQDYSEKTVPERKIVLSYGGEIAIVGDPKDHSTTNIIEKVQSLPK